MTATVDPLNERTRKAFAPVDLEEQDYLFVDLDAEGTRFVLELRSLKKRVGPVPSWAKRVVIDSREFHTSYRYPSWPARQFFNRLPERRAVKGNEWKWIAAATDYTSLILEYAWPKDRIIWKDNAKAIHDYLVTRFASQLHTAKAAARFKEDRTVPTQWQYGGCWREHKTLPLSDYQKCAAELSCGTDGYALFMDRGTGKTPVVVQRVCVEAEALNQGKLDGGVNRPSGGKMMRVLVVCPPQVRFNWRREFERFAVSPGKVSIIRGGPIDRLRMMVEAITPEDDCLYSVAIIGYDSLVPSKEHFAAVPWDLIVCDESHFFKDARTQRFGAIKMVGENARRKMELTGTPIGNSPMDLWSQLEFLGNGLSGFTTWQKFKSFYGQWESVNGEHGVQKLVGLQNLPILQERLARLSFAVSKEEAGLNLPSKVYDIHEVHMEKWQSSIYEKVQRELAVEIEDKLSGDVNEMTIKNVLTMLLRLSQITSGHVVWDGLYDPDTGAEIRPKRIQRCMPNPKVEAVIQMIKENDDPKSKMVVWCSWVPTIKQLLERLEEEGIVHGSYYGATPAMQREENVARFNGDPDFKVLVCNAQTAGEGLNLLGYDVDDPNSECYCDHEVFVSCNWSAILRAQAEDRVHRRGTKRPVRITDLLVPGTIDEDILERLNAKRQMADTVSDLREILRSVLQS
jgi:SNF2 family DNA or RNA helicase